MRHGACLKKRLQLTVWALILTCQIPALPARGQGPAPAVVVLGGISFSSLAGPNGALYAGHTEGDFTVSPSAGDWFQALVYGNPVASIFAPTNGSGNAKLLITDNVDLFNFGSLDFSSNNGQSTYDIQGFLDGDLMYHDTGNLAASFNPFSFNTLLSTDPALQLDSLLIQINFGPGVTSINLDNIRVVTVPEPTSCMLLGGGAVALLLRRGSRRQPA
jgi:hypothetical protein